MTSSDGAVLLDQTTVADAARLLAGTPDGRGYLSHLRQTGIDPVMADLMMSHHGRWPVANAERLLSLSSLCDAILLYDRLYVLSCTLPPDAEDLVLRNELLESGILEEIEVDGHRDAIADELAAFFSFAGSAPDVPEKYPHERVPERLHEVIRQSLATEYDDSGPYDRTTLMVEAFRDELEATVLAPSRRTTDPLLDLGRQLTEDIVYFASGVAFGVVSSLRTFVYWRLAARLRIPFYPSCRRLPSYHVIQDHVDGTIRDQAYGAVAEAFNTTVTEVYEAEDGVQIYLPPALAIFLDALRTEGTIARALESLRIYGQPLRDAFQELQSSSQDSTLRDMYQRKRRFAEVVNELRSPPRDRTNATLNNAIELVPDMVKMGANPLDVANYGKNIVQKPAIWIQDWWRRRPFRFAFKLRDRALSLPGYDRLLLEATGVRISSAEFTEFDKKYNQYLEHFSEFQQGRRPGPVGGTA